MAFSTSLCRWAARRPVLDRHQFVLRYVATRRPIHIQSVSLRSRYFSTASAFPGLSQHEGKVKKFQADTSKLLDIVAKSLYSDKEIFVRELISNASDAVERLRFLQTSGSVRGPEGPLEIHITTDENKRTFTIFDNGVGMTADEMEKNLGTIAKSGSREYVAQLKQSNVSGDDWTNIIGQFGVGFYAAFMVADEVEVQSMSQVEENGRKGHRWISNGTGGIYTIYDSEGVTPGTKVILRLKEDSAEFARESTIKFVIQKYSTFIGVPVFLNGKQINVVEPLWAKDPSKVSEEEYTSFYQFITSTSYDSPRYRITFKADSPINLRALLFVPTVKPSIFEAAKEGGSSLSLYSRKILITNKTESLLPRWLRFVRGVVDSEDIPLNLSRELLQDHGLIRKVNRILTSRVLRFLENESKHDAKNFLDFLNDFGLYLKEGIVTEPDQYTREEIAKLLRFESSALPAGQRTSFDEYGSRMRAGERNIYFLSAPNRDLAEASPYFEAIKKKKGEIEVLFLYEPYDELVLVNMGQYDRKNLRSIEKVLAEDASDTEAVEEIEGDCLSQEEVNILSKWAEETLGSKIKKVKVTRRLSQHPCCVQIREAGAMRHLLRTALAGRPASEKFRVMEPVLELNPRHPLVRYLAHLVVSAQEHAEDGILATALVDYLLDAGLAHAGLLEEAREMAARSSQLLTILSERAVKKQV
uniref:Heat shock protein 75 kDa mitochondrial n=1 Tax=Echinococcus granulosus TaxID=6210 RepID=A0A068W9G0_ECHGR|nr:heat shock protein 75 kDa mitochondrial [Echinococcus granulosus]